MRLLHDVRPSAAPHVPAEFLDALLLLSRSLRGAHQHGILSEALDLLLSAIGCERGAAYVVHDDALLLTAHRGLPGRLRPLLDRLPLTGQPRHWLLVQQAVESRTLLVSKKMLLAGQAPFRLDDLPAAGWEEIVACPISTGGIVFGAVVIGHPSPGFFEASLRALIEIACQVIAPQVAYLSGATPPGIVDSDRLGTAPQRASSFVAPAIERACPPDEVDVSFDEQDEAPAAPAAPVARKPRPPTSVFPVVRSRSARPVEAPSPPAPCPNARDSRPSSDDLAAEFGLHQTVLVVDDERSIREVLRDILADEGYLVETASDGYEALECIRRDGPPGLVLLDLVMPGMDGWRFLAEVKDDATLAEMPVVVLSAVASRFRGPAAEVVSKPVDYRRLLETVGRWARSPGLSRVALEGVGRASRMAPLP